MRKSVVFRLLASLATALVLFASTAPASIRETRLPLKKDGKLQVADLSSAVCHAMDLPAFPVGPRGEIDMTGAAGAIFLEAVNLSLGESGKASLDGSNLVFQVDTDRLGTRSI